LIFKIKDLKPMEEQTKWEHYEEVATYLLNQFRLKFGFERVEKKQSIHGKYSSTKYEIDAKGVCEGNEGFIIIECRRYTNSRQSQEKIASLAYTILDTGARGGILVSPLGIQEGANRIANAENIKSVILDKNSTTVSYFLQFLNNVMIGLDQPLSIIEELKVKTRWVK
jgi:hypothetical protein